MIGNIPDKKRIVDDSILWDKEREGNFSNTCNPLTRKENAGTIINPEKLKFCRKYMKLFLLEMCEYGVELREELLRLIIKFHLPRGIMEIRS